MSCKQKRTFCLVDFLYKDLSFHFNYYTSGISISDFLKSTKRNCGDGDFI